MRVTTRAHPQCCSVFLSCSLTRRVSGDDRFSRLAAYLSILSPSPSTLVTPTPEAFFAFFALLGHLSCSSFHRTRRLYQLWLAAAFYALATTFRANGVLLAGFLLWQLFWQRPWPPRLVTIAITPALVSLSVLPLFLSQAFAYSRFCLGDEGNRREWCDRGIASVYTFVQDHYW